MIRKTATGSGPVTWAHDGTEHGIYDLNGNVWEMAEGIRLINGEIQVLRDNDGVLPECWNDWKAIDKRGKLVKVGSKNTWKFDSTKSDSLNKFQLIEGATPFLSLQRKTCLKRFLKELKCPSIRHLIPVIWSGFLMNSL